jgi:hypothetical protein
MWILFPSFKYIIFLLYYYNNHFVKVLNFHLVFL